VRNPLSGARWSNCTGRRQGKPKYPTFPALPAVARGAAKGASRPERSRDPGDPKPIQRCGTAVAEIRHRKVGHEQCMITGRPVGGGLGSNETALGSCAGSWPSLGLALSKI